MIIFSNVSELLPLSSFDTKENKNNLDLFFQIKENLNQKEPKEQQ